MGGEDQEMSLDEFIRAHTAVNEFDHPLHDGLRCKLPFRPRGHALGLLLLQRNPAVPVPSTSPPPPQSDPLAS